MSDLLGEYRRLEVCLSGEPFDRWVEIFLLVLRSRTKHRPTRRSSSLGEILRQRPAARPSASFDANLFSLLWAFERICRCIDEEPASLFI